MTIYKKRGFSPGHMDLNLINASKSRPLLPQTLHLSLSMREDSKAVRIQP